MGASNILRIFVSSPRDVGEERVLAERVIKRLQSEFADRVTFEPIFWEELGYLATADFQQQIPQSSKADIVVFILWSRLGTPLSTEKHRRPDGSTYASGTEYEFEDALNGHREKGVPDILVYRKTAEPVMSIKNKEKVLERLAQQEAVGAFMNRWFRGADGSFIAAFNEFASLAQFEERLEVHLRERIALRFPSSAIDAEAPPRQPPWQKGSPFRGLEIFDFEHAPVFFGRTQAVGELLNVLRKQSAEGRAFVLVLGGSGVGKSSLVRAGVLPILTQKSVIEGVDLWRRAVLRPSNSSGSLFDSLAAVLVQEEALPEVLSGTTPVELAQLLCDTPKAVVPLIRTALSRGADDLQRAEQLAQRPLARLALVIDQLEEIFTLDRVTPDERIGFMRAIDALARDGAVWVIATLRSDFYHRCAELPQLGDLKGGAGQYDLRPAAPAEISQMLRQPAFAAGLHFETNPETGESLDDVLRAAAARDPNALPLLEYALEELFKQRRGNVLAFAAYRDLGGLEGAIANRANAVLESLDPVVKASMPSVLRALVTLGTDTEAKPVARRVLRDLLANTEGRKLLVDTFIQERLFVADTTNDGQAVVGLAHEALFDHWLTLKDLVEQDREFLRIRARVSDSATHWRAHGKTPDLLLPRGKRLAEAETVLVPRPEDLDGDTREYVKASVNHATRARRRTMALVAIVALVITAFGGFSYVQWGIAERQRNVAEERRAQVEQLRGLAMEVIGKIGWIPADSSNQMLLIRLYAQTTQFLKMLIAEGDVQPETQITLANYSKRLGDIYRSMGDVKQAADYYRRSTAICEKVAAQDPDTLHGVCSQSYEKLGDILQGQGDLAGARKAYDVAKSVAIPAPPPAPVLAEEPPPAADMSNTDSQHDAEIRGEVTDLSTPGGLARAQAIVEDGLAMYQRSVAQDPSDLGSQHGLAVTYNDLGDLLQLRGKLEEALAAYEQSLAIGERLAAQDPSDSTWKVFLADTHDGLAFLHLFARRPTEAIISARRGLEIDPSQIWIYTNLAHGYLFTGRLNEAKRIYLTYKDEMTPSGRRFAEEVLEDFKKLRAARITHPAMPEIEKLLGAVAK
ncbi:MAG: nSTAND1 domain-containing NTPase [Gammaproteobacteria bacterium]